MKIDPHSATWEAVKAFAEKEIVASAVICESPHAEMADTQYHRGRIRVLRELLGLAVPKELKGLPVGAHHDLADGT